jgi:hypothetical protein
MEFDEMKKIWDSQNNEPLYAINEKALHDRILAKKKQAYHITNISELLMIIVNLSVGLLILGINLLKQNVNIYLFLLSAWMLGSAIYVLMSRIRRIKGDNQFERSMRGDLHYAISVATYQVRLSQLGRWSILPIGIFSILGVWGGGKSVWVALGMLIFIVLTNYVARWEHNIYKAKKRELETLQSKLEDEAVGVSPS